MSLGIVIKGPEGIVLAAESRVTLTITQEQNHEKHLIPVSFDNATKLLSFSEPNKSIGVVTYGQAIIGLNDPRTAASFLPELEESLPKKDRLSVSEFANKFSEFYLKQWKVNMPENYKGPDMTFVIGGFNVDEPYGKVYLVEIPRSPTPIEHHGNLGEFGITFGGQREIVDRLLMGFDSRLIQDLKTQLNLQGDQIKKLDDITRKYQSPLPIAVLALQDCVDLAIFYIRATIAVQNFTVGVRGVGGAIDVAIIKRNEPLQFVQRKYIHGESEAQYGTTIHSHIHNQKLARG